MNHQQRSYMNTIHIRENNIISYIICTKTNDDNTEHSLQYVHGLQWLHSMYADDSLYVKF